MKHTNGNDTLKGELAATRLRNEQAEHDMALRETLVAKEATEAPKQSELQVYNQYISEMKTLEAKFAEENERKRVETAEAVRLAIGTNN